MPDRRMTDQPFHAPAAVSPLVVERTLRRVRKPGRYAGGEWNSISKDWASTALKWCFAYPDLYEIGMSNLGLRILYAILNDSAETLAERCFAPDVDLQAELRATATPLWSLETRRALREFDLVGVSLGYELVATNLLDMLDLGGIPLHAHERGTADPLVVAGGSIVLNPEPFADFLDAVVLGEGEDVVLEIGRTLLELGWHRRRTEGFQVERGDVLRALARISGVYVPSLYRPVYAPGGGFVRIDRLDEVAPERIVGRLAADFETRVPAIRQLVPNIGIVFDRAQVEVMRGCTRGCRFCQAGIQSRPLRERPAGVVIEAADRILAATGYEEIGLTSLSTADYTDVAVVAREIRRRHPDTVVSLPSTRVDAFTVDLADTIAPTGRRAGFTFAPEAGSQRMRDVINKGVSDDEIVRCAERAFERGWSTIKLYFMIGLPGETLEDVAAIPQIARRILEIGRRLRGGKAQVKVNVSTFVPKVGTPFQWDGQDPMAVIEQKVGILRQGLHGKGLLLAWDDPRTSILEAALGRGDRRLGPVIERAWRNGSHFDAWNDTFRFEAWQRAFEEAGLTPEWFAQRDVPVEEPLPWDHLGSGVERRYLARERGRAEKALTTADCHWGPCSNCGVPAATGFACDTGAQGPRGLLLVADTDRPLVEFEQEIAPTKWRFIGPPGDPRRADVGSADPIG